MQGLEGLGLGNYGVTPKRKKKPSGPSTMEELLKLQNAAYRNSGGGTVGTYVSPLQGTGLLDDPDANKNVNRLQDAGTGVRALGGEATSEKSRGLVEAAGDILPTIGGTILGIAGAVNNDILDPIAGALGFGGEARADELERKDAEQQARYLAMQKDPEKRARLQALFDEQAGVRKELVKDERNSDKIDLNKDNDASNDHLYNAPFNAIRDAIGQDVEAAHWGDVPGLQREATDSGAEKAAKIAGGFLLDVGLDPISYMTAGAGIMGRAAVANATSTSLRGAAPDLLARAGDEVTTDLATQAARRADKDAMKDLVDENRTTSTTKTNYDTGEITEEVSPVVSKEMLDEANTLPDDLLPGAVTQLATGAAEASLKGGDRAVRKYLKETLGDDLGEEAFKNLPRDAQGGLRFRSPGWLPFDRVAKEGGGKQFVFGRHAGKETIKDANGLVVDRLSRVTPTRIAPGGGKGLEKMGAVGRVFGTYLDSTHTARNAFWGTKVGQGVGKRVGRDGGLFAEVAAGIHRAGNDLDDLQTQRTTFRQYEAIRKDRQAYRAGQQEDAYKMGLLESRIQADLARVFKDRAESKAAVNRIYDNKALRDRDINEITDPKELAAHKAALEYRASEKAAWIRANEVGAAPSDLDAIRRILTGEMQERLGRRTKMWKGAEKSGRRTWSKDRGMNGETEEFSLEDVNRSSSEHMAKAKGEKPIQRLVVDADIIHRGTIQRLDRQRRQKMLVDSLVEAGVLLPAHRVDAFTRDINGLQNLATEASHERTDRLDFQQARVDKIAGQKNMAGYDTAAQRLAANPKHNEYIDYVKQMEEALKQETRRLNLMGPEIKAAVAYRQTLLNHVESSEKLERAHAESLLKAARKPAKAKTASVPKQSKKKAATPPPVPVAAAPSVEAAEEAAELRNIAASLEAEAASPTPGMTVGGMEPAEALDEAAALRAQADELEAPPAPKKPMGTDPQNAWDTAKPVTPQTPAASRDKEVAAPDPAAAPPVAAAPEVEEDLNALATRLLALPEDQQVAAAAAAQQYAADGMSQAQALSRALNDVAPADAPPADVPLQVEPTPSVRPDADEIRTYLANMDQRDLDAADGGAPITSKEVADALKWARERGLDEVYETGEMGQRIMAGNGTSRDYQWLRTFIDRYVLNAPPPKEKAAPKAKPMAEEAPAADDAPWITFPEGATKAEKESLTETKRKAEQAAQFPKMPDWVREMWNPDPAKTLPDKIEKLKVLRDDLADTSDEELMAVLRPAQAKKVKPVKEKVRLKSDTKKDDTPRDVDPGSEEEDLVRFVSAGGSKPPAAAKAKPMAAPKKAAPKKEELAPGEEDLRRDWLLGDSALLAAWQAGVRGLPATAAGVPQTKAGWKQFRNTVNREIAKAEKELTALTPKPTAAKPAPQKAATAPEKPMGGPTTPKAAAAPQTPAEAPLLPTPKVETGAPSTPIAWPSTLGNSGLGRTAPKANPITPPTTRPVDAEPTPNLLETPAEGAAALQTSEAVVEGASEWKKIIPRAFAMRHADLFKDVPDHMLLDTAPGGETLKHMTRTDRAREALAKQDAQMGPIAAQHNALQDYVKQLKATVANEKPLATQLEKDRKLVENASDTKARLDAEEKLLNELLFDYNRLDQLVEGLVHLDPKKAVQFTSDLIDHVRNMRANELSRLEHLVAQGDKNLGGRVNAARKAITDWAVAESKVRIPGRDDSPITLEMLRKKSQGGKYGLVTPAHTSSPNGLVQKENVAAPKGLENTLTTPVIADALENIFRIEKADDLNSMMNEVWDPLLTTWKRWATSGRGPGFSANNLSGGIYNAMLAGATAADWKTAATYTWLLRKTQKELIAKLKSGEVPFEELDDLGNRMLKARLDKVKVGKGTMWDVHVGMEKHGALANNVNSVGIERNLDDASIHDPFSNKQEMFPHRVPEEQNGYHKTVNWMNNNWWMRTWTGASEHTETFLRSGTFVSQVRKYGNDETGHELANLYTKATQFDYADLSEFEKKVLRRIFPFFVWTKNNVPLQVRAIFHEPSKVNAFLALNNNMAGQLSSTEVDDEGDSIQKYIPGYIRESMGWLSDEKFGTDNPIAFASRSPLMDANKFFTLPTSKAGVGGFAAGLAGGSDDAKGLINPFVKMGIEGFSGTNTFTERPFDKRGTEAPAWVPNVLTNLDEAGSDKRLVNEWGMNAFRSLLPPAALADRLIPSTERGRAKLAPAWWNATVGGLAPITPTVAVTPEMITGETSTQIMEDEAQLKNLAAELGVTDEWVRMQVRMKRTEPQIRAMIAAGYGRPPEPLMP